MFKKEDTTSSTANSHHNEAENDNPTSNQQSSRSLYADMITKVDSMLDKLNRLTQPVTNSKIMIHNKEVIVEESEKAKLPRPSTDILPQHPFQSTLDPIEPEIMCVENESPTFSVNDREDSTHLLPSLQAPRFHGISSENPLQFLECVEEFAELVYQSDNFTLLNNVSKFLRGLALD